MVSVYGAYPQESRRNICVLLTLSPKVRIYDFHSCGFDFRQGIDYLVACSHTLALRLGLLVEAYDTDLSFMRHCFL